MSALRDEIRAILREEIAGLLGEMVPTAEVVRINSSADLNRFAQDLIKRAEDPDFAARVASGKVCFELAETLTATQEVNERPIVSSPPKPAGVMIDKSLVTEQDIAGIDEHTRVVRLTSQSRLTPLAKDEARRKGLRIERIET